MSEDDVFQRIFGRLQEMESATKSIKDTLKNMRKDTEVMCEECEFLVSAETTASEARSKLAEKVKEEIEKVMDRHEGAKTEDYFERGMYRGLQIVDNKIHQLLQDGGD